MADTVGPVISPADDQPPDDPFNRVFDEDFVRAATFKEPPAHARVRADRWQQLELAELQQQAARQNPPLPQPAPATRGTVGMRAVVAVVVLVAIALGVSQFGRPAGDFPPTTPVTPAGGTAAPNADAAFFAGSPAAQYAAGADAIVAPAARPVGAFSAQAVARAYDVAKQVLVDTNLNPAVFGGATPGRALALMDPETTKDGVALPDWLRGALAHPDAAHDPTTLISRVRPAEVAFLGRTVKVHGTMSTSIVTDGSLQVVAHYLFVYPVGKPDHSVQPTRMVADRTVSVRLAPGGDLSTHGVYRIDWAGSAFNNSCFRHDGFLHPAFDDSRPYQGIGDVDPYRAIISFDPAPSIPDSCAHATRI